MKLSFPPAAVWFSMIAVAGMFCAPSPVRAVESYIPFDGGKSVWHEGFERFDYVMDEATLAITPFKAPDDEKFGIKNPAQGQRRCVVIAPRNAAAGLPWSWRGCYWDHEPQTEVELLRRGFHVAYISANPTLKPGREWEAWYAFLTEKHGLSKKPAFVGMSRGGEYAYTWAAMHPDEVGCIYADNPGGNREAMAKLGDLAANDVPLLHVCGSIDPLLGRVSSVIEAIYPQLGGRISVMIKDGAAHHPHSLRNPQPIADFITQSVQPVTPAAPDFLGGKVVKTSFYSLAGDYRAFPGEGMNITCRGPFFTNCYDRFAFDLPGVEGTINVIAPKTAAPGMPWVFRAGFADHEATVDLALLAQGFHIVTGPVFYNTDGPVLAQWNATYQHLVGHGFARQAVMEGAGRAAGEVYAWAIANPDKVACIYGENPVLLSFMSKTPLLENLAGLAQAGVPLLSVCGSLDPALPEHTRALEMRYQALGGKIIVLIKEGEGHYPLAPRDPKPVVDFILENARRAMDGNDRVITVVTILSVKLKFLIIPFATVIVLAGGAGVGRYREFHPKGAWIVASPGNRRWAVDVMPSGLVDLAQDFRVHDLVESPFRPRHVCDLASERRYWPRELHWSHDGSVAAVVIGFAGQPGDFYGCAYDFLNHQPLQSGAAGSPLEPSAEFTAAIKELLAARGGVRAPVLVPDMTKPR